MECRIDVASKQVSDFGWDTRLLTEEARASSAIVHRYGV